MNDNPKLIDPWDQPHKVLPEDEATATNDFAGIKELLAAPQTSTEPHPEIVKRVADAFPEFLSAAPQPVSGDAPEPCPTCESENPDYKNNLQCTDPWHKQAGAAPKVEEFVEIFLSRLAGLTEEQSSNVAETLSHMLRRYFPPASQTETDYFWKDGSLKWGHPVDVGHMILQLQTLDPKMKVSSVMHIDMKGGTKARAYGLSMSRERWDEGGWLNWKLEGPECLAIWAKEREPIEGLNPLATPASTARTDGWVSVEERLPEPSKEMLLVIGGHVRTGWLRNPTYLSAKSRGKWETFSGVLTGVTHWQPLPAAPGSVPQAPPKCSEPRIVELNPPNAPDKYAVFIGKVFIWEFDFEKEAEELRDNLKRVGVPQAESPNGRAKAEADMLDASEEASYREKFEGR